MVTFDDKYFTEEQLAAAVPRYDLSHFELVTTDTYSDKRILDSLLKTDAIEPLMCSAIHTSIVGFGNKNFGQMKYKGEMTSISDLYNLHNVKMNLNLSSKIEPDTLTPRRLQRFFRLEVRRYLETHLGVYSYLFKKYSSHDEKFRHCVYPGSEAYITDKDEAFYLIEVYCNMDKKLNTNVAEKISRILTTRGIVTIKDCDLIQSSLR